MEVLKKLPVNRSKSYSRLTIEQLLQLENEPTLSHKTILKHTERVSALFNWVTMLSAYSGARLNEICQLNVSDIQKIDGIWAINLNADPEDKSIKTEAGNRIIPLHPKLIDLGLLDYAKQMKNQNHRKLFPNLKKMKSTGYGTMISRWFRKHLIRLGIKKKGKNFHSFRHTVVNKLTNQKVYEPFIKELIGHSHGSFTLDIYGGRKPLDVLLNECVIKI